MTDQQIAHAVMLVRPAAFAANEQTAPSNHFQSTADPAGSAGQQAQVEFDELVAALRNVGVEVLVLQDTPEPAKPDAIFPNNWLSTHADGSVVLYPMLAPNRRAERRQDALDYLSAAGFGIEAVVDLTTHEAAGAYLEGTGSLVLDRVNRIAYACRSPRTSERVLADFAERMNYRAIVVDAVDASGRPIYHTNVVMCVGRRFALLCIDSIVGSGADAIRNQLLETGHQLIPISRAQVQAFAGNMLEIGTRTGTCIALSAGAARALTAQQKSRLQELGGPLVTADIPTIERLGGGSVRCMLAEIHLPKARPSTLVARPVS